MEQIIQNNKWQTLPYESVKSIIETLKTTKNKVEKVLTSKYL